MLFLFVNERVDLVRQIHSKAHPDCSRTLGWDCSNDATPALHIAFAITPDVMSGLDGGGREAYGDTILGQDMVIAEKNEIYER